MILFDFLHSSAQLPHSLDSRRYPPQPTTGYLLIAPQTFLLKTVASSAQPLTSRSPASPPSDTSTPPPENKETETLHYQATTTYQSQTLWVCSPKSFLLT
ncbi:hypothetical protein ILYODFUR_021331 [Ilyodon furcidens]|uniref:Uncharacterized protein n=1 Tax=Ilyodon furcidens TaxID=33524 RepID=A0ABV0TKH9_9TELE